MYNQQWHDVTTLIFYNYEQPLTGKYMCVQSPCYVSSCINYVSPSANFLASPLPSNMLQPHIPHLPGPLHRVRKSIFFDVPRSVPKSCLSAEGDPGSEWRNCIVLRHVDQKTGKGKRADNRCQSCAGVGRRSVKKKLTGQGNHGDTTVAGEVYSPSYYYSM